MVISHTRCRHRGQHRAYVQCISCLAPCQRIEDLLRPEARAMLLLAWVSLAEPAKHAVYSFMEAPDGVYPD